MMSGDELKRLADILENADYAVKKVELEPLSRFEYEHYGAKYTDEITLRVRPLINDQADAEKVRALAMSNKSEAPKEVEF